jgi:hypothetical protein
MNGIIWWWLAARVSWKLREWTDEKMPAMGRERHQRCHLTLGHQDQTTSESGQSQKVDLAQQQASPLNEGTVHKLLAVRGGKHGNRICPDS